MHAFIRMGWATIAFAMLHSALATRGAKSAAAGIVGKNRRDAGYRVFFVGQSVVTFSLLLFYGAHLPKRTIYRLSGPAALLLRAGQAAGMLHLLAAARQVGIGRISGLENLKAWCAGRPIPFGPVAQGPEIGADGQLRIGGPYTWSRHPLNFSGIPIVWLTPHMTTRRLAFNITATVYFIVGSLHEEVRLEDAYGKAYLAYRTGTVPFYWPRPKASEQFMATP